MTDCRGSKFLGMNLITVSFLWLLLKVVVATTLVESVEDEEVKFFNGKEDFQAAFPDHFLSSSYIYQNYRVKFLLNEQEVSQIKVDLIILCLLVEESGYNSVEVERFSKFLQKSSPFDAVELTTLTRPVCQRVLASTIATICSAEVQARVFNRLSPEVLSNSLILSSFTDFSCLKVNENFREIVKLIVVPGMLLTGSCELVHAIFEARNYEMDLASISVLLFSRPELFADSLFKKDPSILAAITRFNPVIPFEFDAVECFIQSFRKQKSKKLTKSLTDEIVKYWIRSEATLNFYLGLLSNENLAFSQTVLQWIQNEFQCRLRLVSGLERFSNTSELIVLLKTPLNIRLHLKEVELGIPTPYLTNLESFEEIEAAFLSFNIESNHWKLNFYAAFIPLGYTEFPKAIVAAKEKLENELYSGPLADFVREQNDIGRQMQELTCSANYFQDMAKMGNSLSKVLDRLNLSDPGIFALLESSEGLPVFSQFVHLLRPETIQKWLGMPDARSFLRSHPEVVYKLGTLKDFTSQDCREFRIALDSELATNIHTLPRATVIELLEESECVLNGPLVALQRVNPDYLIPSEHWPLISIRALLIEESMERADKWIEMLKITKYCDFAGMSDSELLGVVANWIVHMEWNSLYFFLTRELPFYNEFDYYVQIADKWIQMELAENDALSMLLTSRKKTCNDTVTKRHFELLIEAVKPFTSICAHRIHFFKQIRVFKDSFFKNPDGSAKSGQELTDEARMLNFGVQEVLLAHSQGSERKRQVILNRAKAMSFLHFDLKKPITERLDWISGKYPLEDSFMLWLMENRVSLIKFFIKAKLTPSVKVYSGDEYMDAILEIFYLKTKQII